MTRPLSVTCTRCGSISTRPPFPGERAGWGTLQPENYPSTVPQDPPPICRPSGGDGRGPDVSRKELRVHGYEETPEGSRPAGSGNRKPDETSRYNKGRVPMRETRETSSVSSPLDPVQDKDVGVQTVSSSEVGGVVRDPTQAPGVSICPNLYLYSRGSSRGRGRRTSPFRRGSPRQ